MVTPREKANPETPRLFQRLCREASRCRRCPRMTDRQPVLGPLNGTLTPRILFIGEAPGRRGADRTRTPFSGDASGRNFETLLAGAGLSRAEIFITNAVLCCPTDGQRNHTPTVTEMRNCQPYLARTLELLQPPVVATIGAVALRALGLLLDRSFKLSDDVGRIIKTDPFLLVPLYHPSPRVLNTVRNLDAQGWDFAVLARTLEKCG